MSKVKRSIKNNIERLLGYRAWLEPSSNFNDVRTLIKSLVPVAIEQPLIRIGGQGDGGYLLPDDLAELSSAISLGISTEISFDLEMASRGVPVFMADASVDGPPVEHSKFYFHRKFVDVFEDDNNMRLDTLCQSEVVAEGGDRILQMDIEGAEYRVLLDLSDEVLRSFRIMVIEFHAMDRMFASFPLQIVRATFQKLLRHHHVVHIHPNNVTTPISRHGIEINSVMEFTFFRKDRAKVKPGKILEFPHQLDRNNIANRPSVVLPNCWQ